MKNTTKKPNTQSQYPYMTFAEMKKQFPNAWILLLNPDDVPIERSGNFVYKSKSKASALKKARTLPQGSTFGLAYTGEIKIDKNVVICL